MSTPRQTGTRMAVVMSLAGIVLACGDVDPGILPAPADRDEEVLGMLAGQRIFFGHQSVGRDLLSGIEDLEGGRAPHALRIVDGREASLLGPGVILHSAIGRNENAQSKLEDFKRAIEGGLGGIANLAFMKFCYIDFNAQTDVDALFERYRSTLDGLRARYPSTTFVHLTVPLTTVQGGVKATLKRALGKPVWGERENLKRAAYNARVRQELTGQPVFDLARLESTTAGGQRHLIEVEGRPVEVLAPVYTDDGEHPNEAGRRVLAAELLRFLGSLAAAGSAPAQDP
ncbi:MAG: hypothetical protein ABIJ09_08490 [Pseudomonadota bacterium]